MVIRISSVRRCAAALLVAACLSCTQADEGVTVPVAGTVLLVQIADLTPEQIKRLPPEMMPTVEAGGWIQTDRGLERSKVLAPGNMRRHAITGLGLRINGAPIRWNDDGSYQADVPIDASGELKVDIEYKGKIRSLDYMKTEAIGVSGGGTDIALLWYKLRQPAHASHDEAQEHTHDHVHEAPPGVAVNAQALHMDSCLDYNGPYGDCVNYHDGAERVWTNFAGSDCEEAWYEWGYCWMDFGDDGGDAAYCNTAMNCSNLIGHSSNHHCH